MQFANFIVNVYLDGRDEGYYACPDTWVDFNDNGEAHFMSHPDTENDSIESQTAHGIPDDWVFLDFDFEDAYRLLALMLHLEEDVSGATVNGSTVHLGSRSWIVATDSEADTMWEDALDNYLDEVILPGLPDTAQNYFDRERWKEDARHDGRGHALSSYDGCEHDLHTEEGYYYIFRQS